MAFTTTLTTDIGKVRQLIHDLDSTKPIFPDDQMIQNFLDLEGGGLKCAAALALETIAGNRVMVLQVMQILDLKLDGFSVAKGLLATAKQLRDSAASAAGDDWAGFEIADVVDNSDFAWREYLLKQLIAEE